MTVNDIARQKKAALEAELSGTRRPSPEPRRRTAEDIKAEIQANRAAKGCGGRYQRFYASRIAQLEAELAQTE